MRPCWCIVAFAALLQPLFASRGHCLMDVGRALRRMLDIGTAESNASDARIPGYMYALYQDPGNRQYDVIRSVSPDAESLAGYAMFVYDLSVLEPTERVQKAVLQLETNSNNQFSKAINISIFSLPKQTSSKTYLGSASIHSTLDLAVILDSKSLIDLNQLIVEMDDLGNQSMGLVLYSSTGIGKYAKGHELAKLLRETTTKRRKRSIHDNEIDSKQNNFSEKPKRRKKKKKGSAKANKLQAVDDGYSMVFAHTDQCRMEKLVLNFADIGWEDWVIYPKEFETNYCAGGCLFPLDKESKPTNHATVQSLARSFGRLWDLPEPSCVPDTLAPLTLLYMDRTNHVLLKSYPDMRVVTCACK